MLTVLRHLFALGPLLFGLGFLAPLVAQTLIALNIDGVFGLPPLSIGLGVGGLYGLVAQLRGRWI